MNRCLLPFVFALAPLALSAAQPAKPAKPAPSDIQPPEVRRVALERAERLARTPSSDSLPSDLVSPFNPPGFEKPDPADKSDTRNEAKSGDAKAVPAAPATDRDLLAAVAAKIPTTGTIILGGKPLLISGTNRIEAGSHFTVVYNGQEYELELVAIERTTFTVRYKGEDFTRPIKLVKTP